MIENKEKMVSAISRHYTGEKRIGLVVVFDNVDKRSRDVQLAIFEAAQWFKELTRALVIVNLRDTTFEAHRDEPPLDAFINAVNFYIRSPRFALMIKKRLEIVLENIQQDEELDKFQKFTLESGAQVTYQSGRLGEFLMSIYASLFDKGRVGSIGPALESLAGRNARSALGMFADIISSPHVPTNQIGATAAAVGKIDDDRIILGFDEGPLSPVQQQAAVRLEHIVARAQGRAPQPLPIFGHPRIPHPQSQGQNRLFPRRLRLRTYYRGPHGPAWL